MKEGGRYKGLDIEHCFSAAQRPAVFWLFAGVKFKTKFSKQWITCRSAGNTFFLGIIAEKVKCDIWESESEGLNTKVFKAETFFLEMCRHMW